MNKQASKGYTWQRLFQVHIGVRHLILEVKVDLKLAIARAPIKKRWLLPIIFNQERCVSWRPKEFTGFEREHMVVALSNPYWTDRQNTDDALLTGKCVCAHLRPPRAEVIESE